MSPQNKPKKNKGLRIILSVLFTLLLLLLVVLIILTISYFVLYNRGKSAFSDRDLSVNIPTGVSDAVADNDNHTISYKGKKYAFNENIATILIMGVDQSDFDDAEDKIGYNGQADALYLLVLDTEKNTVSALGISRDTMTDVDVYSVGGEFMRTKKMQVCLAYAYGDGREKSCEMVGDCVSRILYGMPVDRYLALDIDSIAVLNDAVGGVTVPAYYADGMTPSGREETLWGANAVWYLRKRDHESIEGNNVRMQRQQNYIKALVKQVADKTKENITTPLTLYNTMSDYMITDIDASVVTYLATKYLGGANDMRILTVPGTNRRDGEHNEFTVDDSELYEIILDLFCQEI